MIQKKSASGSWMLPLAIFDKKVPFFHKQYYFKVFLGKTSPKVPFFKDSGRCPKILDYTLNTTTATTNKRIEEINKVTHDESKQ